MNGVDCCGSLHPGVASAFADFQAFQKQNKKFTNKDFLNENVISGFETNFLYVWNCGQANAPHVVLIVVYFAFVYIANRKSG